MSIEVASQPSEAPQEEANDGLYASDNFEE